MSTWNGTSTDLRVVSDFVEQLTSVLQKTFARAGDLAGLSISLETATDCYGVLANGRALACGETTSRFSNPQIRLKVDESVGPNVTIVAQFTESASMSQGLVKELLGSMLQLREAERREELLIDELGSNWESLEALYEISTDIQQANDLKEAMRRLIERLTSKQEMNAALYIERQGHLVALAGNQGLAPNLDWELTGPIHDAARARRSLVWNASSPRDVFESSVPSFCRAKALAAAPVTTAEAILGFLVIWRNEGPGFDSPIVRHLEAVAYQVSMLIEGDRLARAVRESELLAQEIEIASSIHKMLLVQEPPEATNCMEIAAFNLPSQSIDGDFHDFFQLNNGAVDVLVGDVMGKGVSAALVGAATKSQFLRAIAHFSLRRDGAAPRPSEIVQIAAKQLSSRLIALERFVTLCYARFDFGAHRLAFVNCGHTSAILLRKQTGDCIFLQGDNMPLGVVAAETYQEESLDLLPGDTFLFYSDGVTESRNAAGEFFGEERLTDCLRNWGALPADALLARIRKEAIEFSGSDCFADDFTCVAVKVRATGGTPLCVIDAEFRSSVDQLPAVREWLEQAVTKARPEGLDEDKLSAMHLALTEAFSNCALHGSDGRDQSIAANASFYPSHVSVSLRHPGKPFAPSSVQPPAFDGSREGGFGVFIICRCVDELLYSRDENGLNTITLVKYF